MEDRPRTEKQTDDSRSSTVGAAILLIGLGVYFLLNEFNMIGSLPDNAWVYLLLIPIGWSGFQAVRAYQADGYWSKSVRDKVFGAAALGLLFAIFVIPALSFGNAWPLFLILIGVMALLREGTPPTPQV